MKTYNTEFKVLMVLTQEINQHYHLKKKTNTFCCQLIEVSTPEHKTNLFCLTLREVSAF